MHQVSQLKLSSAKIKDKIKTGVFLCIYIYIYNEPRNHQIVPLNATSFCILFHPKLRGKNALVLSGCPIEARPSHFLIIHIFEMSLSCFLLELEGEKLFLLFYS